MGQMKSFAIWLANEIHIEKDNERKAFAKAQNLYGFTDDDKAWFHEQYRTAKVGTIKLGIELELKDDDPIHLELEEEG